MSLVIPGRGVVLDPPTAPVPSGQARPITLAPERPIPPQYAPPPRPAPDQMTQMLEYLYRQLKSQYPGEQDADLREAAKRMLQELRAKQSQEFSQRFFPERSQPASGAVDQNEQRPWKYSPGSPGGIQFTDTPQYQSQQQQSKQKQIAEEQANFAKQQAQNQANYRRTLPNPGGPPGRAQPIQPPSQGTPYGQSSPPAADPSLTNMTDQQMAELNAAAQASTGVERRFYRKPDGTVGMAY